MPYRMKPWNIYHISPDDIYHPGHHMWSLIRWFQLVLMAWNGEKKICFINFSHKNNIVCPNIPTDITRTPCILHINNDIMILLISTHNFHHFHFWHMDDIFFMCHFHDIFMIFMTFLCLGFILALGLQSHLAVLEVPDLYFYLRSYNDFTTVAVCLGMSCAKRGTMDSVVTKMLSGIYIIFLFIIVFMSCVHNVNGIYICLCAKLV